MQLGMAEKALQTKLEDQLNCSICLDTFTDPRLLQCSHAFCRQCLAGLDRGLRWQSRSLTCPTCRQVTRVPAHGLGQLPTALHIVQLCGILKEHKDSEGAAKQYYCSEHDKKVVDLFCVTCSELVCWKCIKSGAKHHSHDHQEIDEAIESYTKKKSHLMEFMTQQLLAATQMIEISRVQIAERQTAVEADIQTEFKELHEILDLQQARLIKKLDEITQSKLKDLKSQEAKVETAKIQMSQCLHDKKGSPEELLMKEIDEVKQADRLATAFQLESLGPSIKADMKFTSSVNLATQCQHYGDVVSHHNKKLLQKDSEKKIQQESTEENFSIEIPDLFLNSSGILKLPLPFPPSPLPT